MLSDIRYALRLLTRNPAFSAVAVLTLALGIGVATAIFSVANGLLLRPLPYPDASRIVMVAGVTATETDAGVSPADYLDVRARARSFDQMAAYRPDVIDLTTADAEPARLAAAQVTIGFFEVLGRRAELGRTFGPATDRPGDERLIVLSHRAWRQKYGGDPTVAGRQVRVGGQPATIVGVMPAGFAWPTSAEAWTLASRDVPTAPLEIEGDLLTTRDVHYFQIIARLKAGVPIETAGAELRGIAATLAEQYPASNAGRSLRIDPLRDALVGDVRPAILVLLGAVGVVLLIGCANVAGLVLARAAGREREITVRSALGARRGRIARQLLTESLVLGGIGGVAGLVLSVWLVEIVLRLMPSGVPLVDAIGVDWRVAGAGLAVSLVTGLLSGLAPAWQASRPDLVVGLKEGVRAGQRAAASRLRRTFIVGEIALTLVLLAGAGLLLNSFVRLRAVDPGFLVDAVTYVGVPLSEARYPDAAAQSGFYARLLEGLQTTPGVQGAAVAFPQPFRGANASASFFIDGRPEAQGADRPHVNVAFVSPAYFRTLGIPLRQGRPFDDRDHADAPQVVIVSEALARREWPGEDAVGKRIRFDPDDDWVTIVGVVADARTMGIESSPVPTLYVPYRQFLLPFMGLLVRSGSPPAAVRSLVQSQITTLDPELPLGEARPMTEIVAGETAQPRFRAALLLTFAGLALLLAAVGVYGLISHAVASRAREIGIRLALGATPAQVMRPIVREGLLMAAAGVALGLAGALALTRVLSAFLFGVGATDPLTLGGVSALLLGVVLLASYVPARRAMRVDPAEALRAE